MLYEKLILSKIKNYSDLPCLWLENNYLSYENINNICKNLSNELLSLNISKGDRVILLIKNSSEYIITFLALLKLGVIIVPIDHNSSQDRINYLIENTNAKIILYKINNKIEYDTIIPKYEVKLDFLEKQIFLNDKKLEESKNNINFEITEEDTAIIMFSSGSTGRPKGVVLKHRNLFQSAYNVSSVMNFSDKHKEFIINPMCHSGGWQRIPATLIVNGSIHLYNGFLSTTGIIEDIKKYEINGFFSTPPILRALLNAKNDTISENVKSIKILEIGSASFTEIEIKNLQKIFKNANIFIHYGLTESSRAFILDTKKYPTKLKTVGKESPTVKSQIVDENFNFLPKNTSGQIIIKGNQTTENYWNNIYANEKFKDGWLLTGDYGVIDEDGFLTYLGRKDDMINSGGFHFFPDEVEKELGPIEGIKKYTISGVKDPKGILEQIPISFVVPEDPDNWNQKTFITNAKKILPSHMIPRQVIKVVDLPLTSSGKVDRKKTVDLYFNF